MYITAVTISSESKCHQSVSTLRLMTPFKTRMLYFVPHSMKYNTDTKYSLFITARKRRLGQGYVLTPVCHSVYGEGNWLPSMYHRSHDSACLHQGGVCLQEGLHLGGSTSRGVCIEGGICMQLVGGGGLGRPTMGYYGIRSTSGRYASYWNTFLLLSVFRSSTRVSSVFDVALGRVRLHVFE